MADQERASFLAEIGLSHHDETFAAFELDLQQMQELTLADLEDEEMGLGREDAEKLLCALELRRSNPRACTAEPTISFALRNEVTGEELGSLCILQVDGEPVHDARSVFASLTSMLTTGRTASLTITRAAAPDDDDDDGNLIELHRVAHVAAPVAQAH